MKEYDVPMRWELHTVEKIQATDRLSAEMKAMDFGMAGQPASDPRTWRIEGRIDSVDSKAMDEAYPFPVPPDPMDGWDCVRKPDSYAAGHWTKVVGDYKLHLIGIDAPMTIGMSFPTYKWKIVSDKLDFDVASKSDFDDKVVCRDACLEMMKKL